MLINDNKFGNFKNELTFLNIFYPLKSKYINNIYKIINNNSYIILVLDYFSKTTLYDLIKLNKELLTTELYHKSMIKILKKVIKGVSFIHKNSFYHGDIKPENIIIYDNCKIKLIDFGFSKYIENNKHIENYCGTAQFIAPEIIKKKKFNAKKSDVWSIGILLYKCFQDKYIFSGNNSNEIFNKILNWNNYYISSLEVNLYNNTLIEPFKKLLYDLLFVDPKKRPKAKNILKYDFFN